MPKIKVIIFLSPILFGCQIKDKQHEINNETVNQIISSASGLRFLKEDCGIERMQKKQESIDVIIQLSNLKDRINKLNYNNIKNKSEHLYQEIKIDPTPHNIKCYELEKVLSYVIKETEK